MRLALEVMFEDTKGGTDLGQVTPSASKEPGVEQSLKVGNVVSVSYKAEAESVPAHVVLEWEGGSTSDMVADAVIAIILQVGIPSFLIPVLHAYVRQDWVRANLDLHQRAERVQADRALAEMSDRCCRVLLML